MRLGKTANRNQKTSYAYDGKGNRIMETDPFGGILRSEYDALGRLSQKIEKDGSTLSYQYDALGTIKEAIYHDGRSIQYAYDKENRLTSITDWNGITQLEYDAASRVTKVTDGNGHAIAYSFTKTGQKESMLYPDGSKVAYHYDKAGNLTKVENISTKDTVVEETHYAYDGRGLLTEKLLPNQVKTEYTYDVAGRLLTQKETSPYGLQEIMGYTYDKNGNLIQETNESYGMQNGTPVSQFTTYVYDALSQLIEVSDSSGKRMYVYDEFGNRIRKTEDGTSTSYTYNQRNQLVEERRKYGSWQDITTYAYDGRGNLIEKTSHDTDVSQLVEHQRTKTVYEFDSLDQLVRVETEGVVSEYQYDGLGNRIHSIVTKDGVITEDREYTIDQMTPYGDILATYDENVVFTYGAGLIRVKKTDRATSTDTLRYYQLDLRGSITGLYEESGTLITEMAYDEYGILQTESAVAVDGNLFSYTGHVYEESRKKQEEALYQTWLSLYPDGNFPGPHPTPAQPSVEILLPPSVPGYTDTEIFPDLQKDPADNIIIDFPVNQDSLKDHILWTPPSPFKNDLFGRLLDFPTLSRDMWDNILYSKESKYSRYIPSGWQTEKMDKPFAQILKENRWTAKLKKGYPNASNEKVSEIFDSSGKKIGELHQGHKETYGNGSAKKVTQDHYHLDSEKVKGNNVHHLLPDK